MAAVLVAASTAAGCGATKDASSEARYQFAAGTFVRGASSIGLALAFRSTDGFYPRAVAISGPSADITCYPSKHNGMAPSFGLCLRSNVAAESGTYVAASEDEPGPRVSTHVDAKQTAAYARAVAVRATDDNALIRWASATPRSSYLVSISPATSSHCCDIAEVVVPPGTVSANLTASMTPGQTYMAHVIAFPMDMTRDGPLVSPMNVSDAFQAFKVPPAPNYSFVAGSYRSGGRVAGTAFAVHFRLSEPPRVVRFRISGPTGWNDGRPAYCSMESTHEELPNTDFCTVDRVPLPGVYTAEPLNSPLGIASTAITATLATQPRLSVRARVTKAKHVEVDWRGGLGGPYQLSYAASDGPNVSEGGFASKSRASAVFHRLVSPWHGYAACVTALPPVTSGAVLKSPWNIERACTQFGTQLAGRIDGVVHAPARASGSMITLNYLALQGVPAQTKVEFQCVKGCEWRDEVAGSGTVTSWRFRNVRIQLGWVIELRARRPGYVGLDARLTVQPHGGSLFAETDHCLSPLGARPKPEPCSNFD
jgi:hypothetical protein